MIQFDEIIPIEDNDIVPINVICKYFGIDKNIFDGLNQFERGRIVHEYYDLVIPY